MIESILIYLIQSLSGFFAGALLLRFWLQRCRAPQHNPLSTFIQALTNKLVIPCRRWIPGLWGFDWSSLLLSLLVIIVEAFLCALIRDRGVEMAFSTLLLLALVMWIRLALYLAIGLIFMLAILSWMNPSSPFLAVTTLLTRPLLQPLQKILPPVGQVDLSPMVALLLLQLIAMGPLAYLERWLGLFF